MMKKTHMAFGVTFSKIMAGLIGVKVTPIFILYSAVASVLSDIDHPNGSINQKLLLVKNGIFKIVTYLSFAFLIMMYGPKHFEPKIIYFTVPIFIAVAFSRHRGVTHSILAAVVVSAFMGVIKAKYGINMVLPVVLGFISHILIDMFNPKGVELFWPYKKNFRFPVTVDTGGIGEKGVFLLLVLGLMCMFAKSYMHLLFDIKGITNSLIHLFNK